MIIPYNRQFIDNEDIKIVTKSLKDDFITTGKYNQKFEKKIVKKLKCKFASVVNSGTAALHLSFLSIGIKKDDTIIMPSINFIASFNLCQSMGANIYLADVDKMTGQMTPQTLTECIKKNKLKKIKAVISMYLGGSPNNVISFFKIKKRYNFFLIEDACHALGSRYTINKKNFFIGSSRHSDICIFSLHAIKTITTGEGGIVCTNNKILFEKVKSLKSHGIFRNSKKKHWTYDVVRNGLNYRLSDISCALGISQLSKIDKFVKRRVELAKNYFNLLKNNNLISVAPFNSLSAYHLFIISIDFSKLKKNKDFLLEYLKKNNILAQFHYIPNYKFSVYKKKKLSLINTEYYFKNSFSIPLYYKLKFNEQKYIIDKIVIFMKKNKK